MVSEVQRERVLPETVPIGIRDFDDLIQNTTEPQPVDESFIRCHGWLGHLGDSERRTEADNRVHRERDHDDAVFSSSDVDIQGESGQWLEKDTVAKWKDGIYLFGKH